MRFSKEIKIAILTIVTGTMLYTGFNFLKGNDTFSNINTYTVYYKNVDGLVQGNPVSVNGLTVGQVKDLYLDQERGNLIKAILQVDGKIKLTDSSRAKLVDGSLLGGKSVVLELRPGKELKDGDEIRSYIEPSLTQSLTADAKPIMQGIDKTLGNINALLNAENQKKMNQTLANVEVLTRNVNNLVEANKASMTATMANVNKLTNSLVETEKHLRPLLVNLTALSDSLKDAKLKATVAHANQTMTALHQTIDKINKGKGTMGKLVNDDSLYVHLNKAAKDLDQVFLDLKARPGRYIHFSVFGKKDK